MRVLWLTQGYPTPNDTVTGIFHQTQARALAALGIEVTVIACTPYVPQPLAGHSRWQRYATAPREQWDGPIRVLRPRYLATSGENMIGVSWLMQWLAISQLKLKRPDLIHAHFAYPAGRIAAPLSRHWQVPSLLTLHGDDVTVYPWRNAWIRRQIVAALESANTLMAVSPALALLARRLVDKPVEILPTGIHLGNFHRIERLEARYRLNIPQNDYVVLYVGHCIQQKGILEFAEALRIWDRSDVLGIVVGDGPIQPIGPGLRYEGPRPYADIPLYLSAADVYVLPSHHEGLGQSAVEAGAIGVPVIGTETGGLADLLADGRGLLVPPKNAAALAQALSANRADPTAQARSATLYQLINERHDLHRNTAALKALYDEVLTSR